MDRVACPWLIRRFIDPAAEFHMDYGSNAAMYIDAFKQNVNWDECKRRLEEANKMYASLRH